MVSLLHADLAAALVDCILECLACHSVDLPTDLLDLAGPVRPEEGVYLELVEHVDEPVVGCDLGWHAELWEPFAEFVAVLGVPVAVLVAVLGVARAVCCSAVPVIVLIARVGVIAGVAVVGEISATVHYVALNDLGQFAGRLLVRALSLKSPSEGAQNASPGMMLFLFLFFIHLGIINEPRLHCAGCQVGNLADDLLNGHRFSLCDGADEDFLVSDEAGEHIGRAVAVRQDLDKVAGRFTRTDIVERSDHFNHSRNIPLTNRLRVVVKIELLTLWCVQVEAYSAAAELGASETTQSYIVARIEQLEGDGILASLHTSQPAQTVFSRRVHQEQRSQGALSHVGGSSDRIDAVDEYVAGGISSEPNHLQNVVVICLHLHELPSEILSCRINGGFHFIN